MEAAEARQVMAALRAAPPQLVVRADTRRAHVPCTAGTGLHAGPAWDVSTEALDDEPCLTGAAIASAIQQPAADLAAEAAFTTTVAAFSPQLSAPLTLGLHYTNSGVLAALCLLGSAVLWPR